MTDRTYTLNEAQKELARRECAMHGHDWEIIVKFGGDPTHVLCPRCGKGWTVLGSTSGSNLSESTGRAGERTDAAEPSGT